MHKAALVRQIYGVKEASPFKLPVGSILDLLIRIVECLDPRVLECTLAFASGGQQLHQERCWQMEVYRVCQSLLPLRTTISPDVGPVSTPCNKNGCTVVQNMLSRRQDSGCKVQVVQGTLLWQGATR